MMEQYFVGALSIQKVSRRELTQCSNSLVFSSGLKKNSMANTSVTVIYEDFVKKIENSILESFNIEQNRFYLTRHAQ